MPRMVDGPEDPMTSRTIPIITPTIQMSAPSPGDPMEITTPTNSSPPHAAQSGSKSPGGESNSVSATASTATANGSGNGASASPPDSSELAPKSESSSLLTAPPIGGSGSQIPAAAAPAVHQPKIVQTAFIHKLYK